MRTLFGFLRPEPNTPMDSPASNKEGAALFFVRVNKQRPYKTPFYPACRAGRCIQESLLALRVY
jgi:hypothetical protein